MNTGLYPKRSDHPTEEDTAFSLYATPILGMGDLSVQASPVLAEGGEVGPVGLYPWLDLV